MHGFVEIYGKPSTNTVIHIDLHAHKHTHTYNQTNVHKYIGHKCKHNKIHLNIQDSKKLLALKTLAVLSNTFFKGLDRVQN